MFVAALRDAAHSGGTHPHFCTGLGTELVRLLQIVEHIPARVVAGKAFAHPLMSKKLTGLRITSTRTHGNSESAESATTVEVKTSH